MQRIPLILSLFLVISSSYAQDKIVKLTYEVVDTSLNQTKQADQIYNWITKNIAYDTKQLTRHLKNFSPEQTIKRKKAVCTGYSELFYEMCSVLDIECYIINGYSKGFGYVKGDHFTKSDHSWNIVYADSSWIIIDATWGSGSLSYTYDLKSKIKRTVNKNTGIKKRIVFEPNQEHKYFNISSEEICKTHFPLDSKWQLKNYPVSYYEFVSDTASKNIYLNFASELSIIRGLDAEEVLFVDAKNSTKYNPYNKFNIAYQYYNQANKALPTRKYFTDSTLYKSLIQSLDSYDSVLYYLREYKIIRRNLYKTKSRSNKHNYKYASKTIKWITKIPTNFNNRYSKENNKLLRNERLLERERLRIYALEYHLPELIEFEFDSVNSYDTLTFNTIVSKTNSSIKKAENYLLQLVSYGKQIELAFYSGQNQNDSITKYLQNICHSLDMIQNSIEDMDEYDFMQSCIDIKLSYLMYDSIIESKKELEDKLTQDLYKYQIHFEGAARALRTAQRNYERLAKLSGENKFYAQKISTITTPLFSELYSNTLETLGYITKHNDSWKKLLWNQNRILSTYGKKGLQNIGSQLDEYYYYTSLKREKQYNADMKLYESIQSNSKNNKSKIRDYTREIKKTLESRSPEK